jgi:hypothetical protein
MKKSYSENFSGNLIMLKNLASIGFLQVVNLEVC